MTPLPNHADAALFAPCYHGSAILQSQKLGSFVEGQKTPCHSYPSKNRTRLPSDCA